MRAAGGSTPAATLRARFAYLVREHKMTPAELARLTDRQVYELCLRPADEEASPAGSSRHAVAADGPVTLQSEKRDLFMVCHALKVSPQERDDLVRQLEDKWAAKEVARG